VLAAPPATKDEAMAMVKGAVASIKKDGPDAAYAEISNKNPVIQQIENKQTYCERYENTAVCAGVYKF
jgi:hypothetical protein